MIENLTNPTNLDIFNRCTESYNIMEQNNLIIIFVMFLQLLFLMYISWRLSK